MGRSRRIPHRVQLRLRFRTYDTERDATQKLIKEGGKNVRGTRNSKPNKQPKKPHRYLQCKPTAGEAERRKSEREREREQWLEI